MMSLMRFFIYASSPRKRQVGKRLPDPNGFRLGYAVS